MNCAGEGPSLRLNSITNRLANQQMFTCQNSRLVLSFINVRALSLSLTLHVHPGPGDMRGMRGRRTRVKVEVNRLNWKFIELTSGCENPLPSASHRFTRISRSNPVAHPSDSSAASPSLPRDIHPLYDNYFSSAWGETMSPQAT